MIQIDSNKVTAKIKPKSNTKGSIANNSEGMSYRDTLSIEDVISYWEQKPIGVELKDGSDVLLQDNGYTIEDALNYMFDGNRLFIDMAD